MGGKKKQSLKQMEKAQQKKESRKEKEKRVAAAGERKSIPGITTPTLEGGKLAGELKKMKVLTPYSVASRFDLRLSVARGFLKELERKGMIQFVSRSRNLEIYKPAD